MDEIKDLEIEIGPTKIDEKFEKEVAEKLREVPRIEEFIRLTMANDVKRHFTAASPVGQFHAKGAYMRMNYLLNLIRDVGNPVKKKVETRLPGKRYAK